MYLFVHCVKVMETKVFFGWEKTYNMFRDEFNNGRNIPAFSISLLPINSPFYKTMWKCELGFSIYRKRKINKKTGVLLSVYP